MLCNYIHFFSYLIRFPLLKRILPSLLRRLFILLGKEIFNIKFKDLILETNIRDPHDREIFFTQKLSKKLLLNLFDLDFNEAVIQYKKHYHKYNFSKNIREVLIEMIFQLGINGQKKFLKMNEYMKKKQVFMASLEMINSLWYSQTPKRVDYLINILLKRHDEKKEK